MGEGKDKEFLRLADAALKMPSPPPSKLPMIERVERALVVIAYLLELYGDDYIPLYERFEQELNQLRRKNAVRQRARKRLQAFVRARKPGNVRST